MYASFISDHNVEITIACTMSMYSKLHGQHHVDSLPLMLLPQMAATKMKALNCIQRLCMLQHYILTSLELRDRPVAK